MNTPDKLSNAVVNVHRLLQHNPKDFFPLVVRGLSALGGLELVSENPRADSLFPQLEKSIRNVVAGSFSKLCTTLNEHRRETFQTQFLDIARKHANEKAEERAVERTVSWLLAVEENLLARWKCYQLADKGQKIKLAKEIGSDLNTVIHLASQYSEVIEMDSLAAILENRQKHVRSDLAIFDPLLCSINAVFWKLWEKNREAQKSQSVFEQV